MTPLDEFILDNLDCYCTAAFLAKRSGYLDENNMREWLDQHPEYYRKSVIKIDGKPLYMKNTKFSRIKDYWNGFRYLNWLKYS